MFDEVETDITTLRYVLYARKSTDDPGRQIRSIDDQIAECKDLAKHRKLNIVEILQEKKSAKKPGQRPIFTKMLQDLRKGKYDGILAWNPDRLARNMKEGGEIIDMVDEIIIKDMQFVTQHFSNDANGKMLLGMAFVLSKQYSDNLSQNVTRGVRRNLTEGKANNGKHGYTRSELGLLVPDGENFKLMREAWQMRKRIISLEEIAKYMNENGYGKIVKSTGKRVLMDKRMLSEIFKDPFYYGILIQTKQKVDLREIYDFLPAISEEEFFEIQQQSQKGIRPYKQKYLTFYPLKQMIKCAICKSTMYAGPSKGHQGERWLYYRCDNKFCSRKKKSIRAKVIFQFIYKFLEEGLNFSEKDYIDYNKGITSISLTKRDRLQRELHTKQGLLKLTDQEVTNRSLKVVELPRDSTVRKVNEARIDELIVQKSTLEEEIEGIKAQLGDPEKEKVNVSQFLNLSKNAAMVVKMAHVTIQDRICRYIFLNLFVDEEKVASYQAKEPFATLLKLREVRLSRGERT